MPEPNGNGAAENGTPKVSPYAQLAGLDANFTGIMDRLTEMGGKAKGDLKTEIDTRIATTKLLRHQVISLVAGRLADYEGKQAEKLSRARGSELDLMELNEKRVLLDMQSQPVSALYRNLLDANVEFFEQLDSIRHELATNPAIKFIDHNVEKMRRVVVVLQEKQGDGDVPVLDALPEDFDAPPVPHVQPLLIVKGRPRRGRNTH